MPRDEIIAKLLCAHENQPKFFPRVDYREVDFWLKSFEEGNFSLQQEPKYPENANLVNLPVIESIIHMGNTKEQRALRGTCRSVKNVLDGAERLFEKVHIGTNQNAIFLDVSPGNSREPHKAVYRKKETECEITKDGETIQSKKDFITEAFEDFKKTIERIHTKIKLLIISCEKSLDVEQRNNFYDNIVEILSKLKFKIHVEKLEISVWTPDQVLPILSEINQNNLTALNIESHEEAQLFPTDDIIVQPFWKNLKFVQLHGRPFRLELESVQHIPHVCALLRCTFTQEEIKNYRDSILKTPDFEDHSFFFHGWNIRPRHERWEQAIRPFTPILNEFGEETPFIGTLPAPDGKVISFKLTDQFILFSTTRKFT